MFNESVPVCTFYEFVRARDSSRSGATSRAMVSIACQCAADVHVNTTCHCMLMCC